eukprot:UN14268
MHKSNMRYCMQSTCLVRDNSKLYSTKIVVSTIFCTIRAM